VQGRGKAYQPRLANPGEALATCHAFPPWQASKAPSKHNPGCMRLGLGLGEHSLLPIYPPAFVTFIFLIAFEGLGFPVHLRGSHVQTYKPAGNVHLSGWLPPRAQACRQWGARRRGRSGATTAAAAPDIEPSTTPGGFPAANPQPGTATGAR
jgi:hypothetical protein